MGERSVRSILDWRQRADGNKRIELVNSSICTLHFPCSAIKYESSDDKNRFAFCCFGSVRRRWMKRTRTFRQVESDGNINWKRASAHRKNVAIIRGRFVLVAKDQGNKCKALEIRRFISIWQRMIIRVVVRFETDPSDSILEIVAWLCFRLFFLVFLLRFEQHEEHHDKIYSPQ